MHRGCGAAYRAAGIVAHALLGEYALRILKRANSIPLCLVRQIASRQREPVEAGAIADDSTG